MRPETFQPEDRVAAASIAPGSLDIRRVIVGVDDSESGVAALAHAVRLAQSRHAQLVAVRAWALGLPRHGGRRHRHLSHPHVVLYFNGDEQRVAARTLAERALRQAAGPVRADLDVVVETPSGDPGVVLTDAASRPGDVLVVGHWPHVTARGVVHGSVAAYCLRHARCPVIVVPSPEPEC